MVADREVCTFSQLSGQLIQKFWERKLLFTRIICRYWSCSLFHCVSSEVSVVWLCMSRRSIRLILSDLPSFHIKPIFTRTNETIGETPRTYFLFCLSSGNFCFNSSGPGPPSKSVSFVSSLLRRSLPSMESMEYRHHRWNTVVGMFVRKECLERLRHGRRCFALVA